LAFAVARAVALAVRDELLFRGIPLTAAARAGVPAPVARAFAALVGGASIVMIPGVSAAAVALAVAPGGRFAARWGRERGGVAGAHAAWTVLVGSVIHGGILDVEWTTGELAWGVGATGAPAWVAAAAMIAASLPLPRLPWPAASGRPDR